MAAGKGMLIRKVVQHKYLFHAYFTPRDFCSAIHKLAPEKDRIPVNLTHNNVTASTSLQKANLLIFNPTTNQKHSFQRSLRSLPVV